MILKNHFHIKSLALSLTLKQRLAVLFEPEMAYLFDIFSHFTGAFYVWVKGTKQRLLHRIDLKQQYPRD